MSLDLVNVYTTQYTSNLALKLQQKVSRLRPHVLTGNHEGELASPVNQLAPFDPQTPAGKFAPLNRTDPSFDTRWVTPIDKELAVLVDKFDKLKVIIDPESDYVKNSASGFGREWDRQIIDAFFATSKTGKTGTGTEAFDTSEHGIAVDFGASADIGLTVAKLNKAVEIFEEQEIDLEEDPASIVISPRQHFDLRQQVEVTSSDFNGKAPVLVKGRVTEFMGFNIIVSNKLNTVSGDRACPVFVRSGMYLGMWQDLQHNISHETQLSSQPWQLYSKSSSGATRLEAGKVLRILCDEA
jgi:hypothetical protein